MPRIELTTYIKAPIDIVFDLSRSIDLHIISTDHTKERAIGGVTSGLIGPMQSVTWRAKHFGMFHNLTSQITEYSRPTFFVDELQQGIFKSFRHEHHFKKTEFGTEMYDLFDFESPGGFLGKIVNKMVLKKYMTDLLLKRNNVVKEFAESGKWQSILAKEDYED